MTALNLDDLNLELSPEEVEELEQASAANVQTVDSPFSAMIANFLQGGGRMRQQQVLEGSRYSDNQVIENGRLYGQNFDSLRAECLSSGQLWTDPEFPPDDRSLYYSQRPPFQFQWMRPTELAQRPYLFEGESSRFDINQGELGDCWLLAALANLTLNKKLFYRVVPKDQSFQEQYAGIFHFQFWQYGEWVDVVVDDFLPTRAGELMFTHSEKTDEFWSALVEKAYAKLHGGYEALKGGSTSEAMVDFTGGCSEYFNLKDKDCPKDLMTIMLKGYHRASMMGCSIEPDPRVLEARTEMGLVRGHAYSITKVVKAPIQTPRVQGTIPLLRIRNPWGNEAEWKGAWSDGSPEWQYISDDEKETLGINFSADGEFWMSYKDFMKHFDTLEICNLGPDSLDGHDRHGKPVWEVDTFQGEWVPGDSAGGCRNFIDTFACNPQYVLRVDEHDEGDEQHLCTVLIDLMQKGRRNLKDEGGEVLTIGFGVYYLRDPDGVPHPLDTNFFRYNKSAGRSKVFTNLREVSERFRMPPGTYVVVPSTFNPNEGGEFMLRIFTEKSHEAHVHN